jgi:uncharacterized protein
MTGEEFVQSVKPLVDFVWLDGAIEFLGEHMEQDGGHDFAHLLRVLRNAATIAENEGIEDWEVLSMAVLFHDSVNVPKNHPDRHLASTLSATLGAEFAKTRLNEKRLEVFVDAIRAHSHSAGFKPAHVISEALADADRLESVGAFGIARTFYVSGVMGRSIVNMADPFAAVRPLDDLNYAVDHFYRKLLTLRDKMYTATGRQMAEQRHTFLQTFLTQLSSELGGSSDVMNF